VDNKLVVDNDGRHGPGNKCAAIDLEDGQHPIRVEFFRADGQASIIATYRCFSEPVNVLCIFFNPNEATSKFTACKNFIQSN
jgi:hypothetical protein